MLSYLRLLALSHTPRAFYSPPLALLLTPGMLPGSPQLALWHASAYSRFHICLLSYLALLDLLCARAYSLTCLCAPPLLTASCSLTYLLAFLLTSARPSAPAECSRDHLCLRPFSPLLPSSSTLIVVLVTSTYSIMPLGLISHLTLLALLLYIYLPSLVSLIILLFASAHPCRCWMLASSPLRVALPAVVDCLLRPACYLTYL